MGEDGKIKRPSDDRKFRPADKLDPELQQELDEALGDMSIEELIDQEDPSAGRGQAGREGQPDAALARGVRRGTVMDIQGDDIFVELGGKRQGLLPAGQFADEPLPEIGQTVEFVIEGVDDKEGLLILSRQGAILRASWDNLQSGSAVEARVTGFNKGGLELTVNGIEAFMPISQIERFRVDDISGYVGQKFQCKVTEIDRREGKLIVSRRDLLEAEAASKAREMFDSLEPGQTVSGVVRTVMPYGAFVDIGGIDGLLHVSDMSYARVEKPTDVVSEGERVDVVVLKVDREARRISLGLKQAKPDPWTGAGEKWPVGEIAAGRIVRMEPFGAFMELEPGVDGLIPISELSFQKRLHHPREVLSEGQVVKVRVMTVDAAARRISLSLKRAGDDPWTGASVRWPEGSVVRGQVTRLAEFGAFVELASGVEGLVHISELQAGFVKSVGEVVREGDVVEAKVISVDEAARRISLSIKQLAESADYTGSQIPGGTAEPEPSKPRPSRNRPLKGGLG